MDYENEDGKEISIFAREIERKETVNKNLSYLVFFQGGPGYESPRPITDSGWIKRASEEYKVLLFMKGSPYQPQCGFSAKVTQILFSYDVEFSYIDVLEFPEVRANLPKISDWPTFPQLFVDGELIGGCDIVTEMHQNDELSTVLS